MQCKYCVCPLIVNVAENIIQGQWQGVTEIQTLRDQFCMAEVVDHLSDGHNYFFTSIHVP